MTSKKYLNGRWRGQQEFKDLIAEAVGMRGAARPAQIAADLKYDDRQGLATTMNNMVKQGWINRDANGLYTVSPRYEIRHRRLLEMDIVDTIKRFGGLATWSEIMATYDTLPSHQKHLPFGGRGGGLQGYLTEVMKKCDRIHHYALSEKKRMWGLSWEEMLKLPLTGRNAEFLMQFEFVEITGPAGKGGAIGEAKMRESVAELFNRVGLAATETRYYKDMSPAEVTANEEVRNALLWIKNRAPELCRAIDRDIERDAWRKAREDERGDDDGYVWELREAGKEDLLNHMLIYFEQGDPLIHKQAPLALYYAFGGLFNICPASLSRGLAVKLLNPVELLEGWQDTPELPPPFLGDQEVEGAVD